MCEALLDVFRCIMASEHVDCDMLFWKVYCGPSVRDESGLT